jgi:hypothetical protein
LVLQVVVEASQAEALGVAGKTLGYDVDFTRPNEKPPPTQASTATTTTNWRPYASHVYSLVTPKRPTGSTLLSASPEKRIGG